MDSFLDGCQQAPSKGDTLKLETYGRTGRLWITLYSGNQFLVYRTYHFSRTDRRSFCYFLERVSLLLR